MLFIKSFLLVQLALVVLMVTLIHFIEAYGLNPAIYSAHLKLHPLLVLTVLVVAEHSLGVWGLLLAGVPAYATRPFTVHWKLARDVMRHPQLGGQLPALMHSDAALCVVACVRTLKGVSPCSAGDCLHHGLHCQVRWHLLQSYHMMPLCSQQQTFMLPKHRTSQPQNDTAKGSSTCQSCSGYEPESIKILRAIDGEDPALQVPSMQHDRRGSP